MPGAPIQLFDGAKEGAASSTTLTIPQRETATARGD
jgi:hypothetical protein